MCQASSPSLCMGIVPPHLGVQMGDAEWCTKGTPLPSLWPSPLMTHTEQGVLNSTPPPFPLPLVYAPTTHRSPGPCASSPLACPTFAPCAHVTWWPPQLHASLGTEGQQSNLPHPPKASQVHGRESTTPLPQVVPHASPCAPSLLCAS